MGRFLFTPLFSGMNKLSLSASSYRASAPVPWWPPWWPCFKLTRICLHLSCFRGKRVWIRCWYPWHTGWLLFSLHLSGPQLLFIGALAQALTGIAKRGLVHSRFRSLNVLFRTFIWPVSVSWSSWWPILLACLHLDPLGCHPCFKHIDCSPQFDIVHMLLMWFDLIAG